MVFIGKDIGGSESFRITLSDGTTECLSRSQAYGLVETVQRALGWSSDKERREAAESECKRLLRSNAALRGALTRRTVRLG